MAPFARLAFTLRSAVPWSAPAWKRVRPRDEVLAGLSTAARERAEALERTGGGFARWRCSLPEWRESLYVLDVLTRLLPHPLPPGRGLDVGSKNGCTLPGLVTASPRGWDLVELDAHRRYAWGATRRAYGERLARDFEGCRFHAADVLTLPGPWAVVTWFLPFLTPRPVEAWGLPPEVLQPERLLRHVVDRLLPGGALLVVNQGEDEAARQGALFDAVGRPATAVGRVESVLSPFSQPRFGWVLRG